MRSVPRSFLSVRSRRPSAPRFTRSQTTLGRSASLLLLWVTLTSGTVLADATPVGDEFQINAYTTGIQGLPNAAVAPDGSFVVIWESDGQDGDGFGTFLRRFDRQGNALTGDLQVAENTFSDQVDADVAMYSDGSFVVVWDADGASDGSYRGIFGRCFDSAGAPVGGEFAVNQGTLGDQNDAVIAPTVDGGFVVVWESHPPLGTYEDLLARRFDSSAQPVGNDYQINVFTTGDQEDADIAVDGSGNFVVVWESDAQDGSYDGVFGRRLDSSGQPLGDEFAVNTYVPGDQDNPSLAVRSDGSFVVAWEDNTQLGLDDSIWARFFDSTGSPTTTPFQVETATGVQFLPRVAIDSEGQAVVVWEGEEAGDPSMADVYYRVFEDTGQALTNEATIPLQDDGNQTLPVVAFNGIGDGIVAWMTNIHDGDAVGVFARRLGSPIFTDGFESGNTAAWSITVD